MWAMEREQAGYRRKGKRRKPHRECQTHKKEETPKEKDIINYPQVKAEELQGSTQVTKPPPSKKPTANQKKRGRSQKVTRRKSITGKQWIMRCHIIDVNRRIFHLDYSSATMNFGTSSSVLDFNSIVTPQSRDTMIVMYISFHCCCY